MKVHHIAYAVSDVESASNSFKHLGYDCEGEPCNDLVRGVRILFMHSENGIRIELVAPLRDDSPVTSQLESSHGTPIPYHICYEVPNIEVALKDLVEHEKVLPLTNIEAAPAIDGRNVCFAFGKNLGLIELLEKTPSQT